MVVLDLKIVYMFIVISQVMGMVQLQINYYEDKWTLPERIYEAIELHQMLCENPITEYYNATIEKLVVSAFIGHFKFTGVDPRVRRENYVAKRNNFQGGFPHPPLIKADPLTKLMCEVDSQDCLHFIYKQLKIVSLEKIIYVYGSNVYPGKNRRIITVKPKRDYISQLKLFTFQTTSMVYLCYWSILVDDPINEMDWSCRFPGKTFKKITRSRCILNAFCPNPCCGARKRVNNTNIGCDKAGAGICTALTKFPNSKCIRREGHDVYRGTSFSELAASGPSFQCGCSESEEWHSDYLACLDKDECLNGTHKCDSNTQYCVNRPKGYYCVCRWGHLSVGRYLCEAKPIESLRYTEVSIENQTSSQSKLN